MNKLDKRIKEIQESKTDRHPYWATFGLPSATVLVSPVPVQPVPAVKKLVYPPPRPTTTRKRDNEAEREYNRRAYRAKNPQVKYFTGEVPAGNKYCAFGAHILPLEEFQKSKSSPDGRGHRCRGCCKLSRKKKA